MLPELWIALAAGTLWGLVMGVLPGITGLTALVVAVPFAVTLDPLTGLVLLVAIHAVSDTGGAVTAIMLAIPGTPSNMATVEDGHALAKDGHASRAIAASAFASALGGVGGFLLLVVSLPFALALVRNAGAPEILAFCVLGLFSAARLGSDLLWKGLLALGLGLFLGSVGQQSSTGLPRLWFEQQELLDGFQILAAATGLFAGPEMVRLLFSSERVPVETDRDPAAVTRGFADVIERPIILAKSSLIGWIVGILPGVGGSVSSMLSYAMAGVERNKERNVAGSLDGVVAAEAGNNAKEGGDIIPTLTLGLPGGAGMAVLIGALMVMGMSPGPKLLGDHPEFGVGIAFALLTANILGGLIVAFGSPLLIRVLHIPKSVLVPLAICLALIGVLGARGAIVDLWVCAGFALLGIVMVSTGLSRPALMVGLVLAPIIETYASISVAAYGWSFLMRPAVIVAMLLAVIVAFGWRHRTKTWAGQ